MKPLRILMLVAICCTSGCGKRDLPRPSAQKVETGTAVRLNRVLILSDSVWLVAGGEKYTACEVLRTADAGATWTRRTYPEPGKGVYGLCAAPGGSVYGSSFDGKLLYSTDSGQTFHYHQIPDYLFYTAVAFGEGGSGVLASSVAQDSGALVRVSSVGAVLGRTLFSADFADVLALSSANYLAAGLGSVLRSTDSGATWTLCAPLGDDFVSIAAAPDGTCFWVAGSRGSVWRSKDGGISWNKLRKAGGFGQPSYTLTGICFDADAHRGWAVGEEGVLLFTTDGGESWKEYARFTNTDLRGVALAPSGRLLVCGDGGEVWLIER